VAVVLWGSGADVDPQRYRARLKMSAIRGWRPLAPARGRRCAIARPPTPQLAELPTFGRGPNTATQEAKLKAAGCTLIRTETVSGGSRNGRDELASTLDFIRPGDVLIVVKLDRLGRNTRDVLNLVHELEEKGAGLRVLEPAIDTGGPMGRMVLTVLGMVAEVELGFIRDRQRTGIEAAKAKGVYKGRPATFDRNRIVALRKEGMGATEIARAVGCKRGNVHKALKAAGLN
jgi:DNA invertase Pin-like site-specific DNA recombinase